MYKCQFLKSVLPTSTINSDSPSSEFMTAFIFAILNTLCQTGLFCREKKAQEGTYGMSLFGINTVVLTINSQCSEQIKKRMYSTESPKAAINFSATQNML